MGKKHKHPEHVNLERYLISYADFITLLFATFVVLYALSQTDIADFKKLEESLKQAFAAPSVIQGADSIMDASSNTIFEAQQADSVITPLMMEYMSQKYEEQAMNEIEKKINEAAKEGDLKGIEATRNEKGLLIRFNSSCLFQPGSADITADAKTKLDKVGVLIAQKFVLHNIRIEGHTDSDALTNKLYPSNWELSSARSSAIVRYYINRFKFMPVLFTAVGFADTRPIAPNNNAQNKSKNRRVEILILKNKYKSQESPVDAISKMSKKDQEKLQDERVATINSISTISEAAKKLANGSQEAEQKTIILNKVYNKELKRINLETKAVDKTTRESLTGEGSWLKPPASHSSKVKVFTQKE